MPFSREINTTVHFAATVASKFTRFKSSGLQRVEYTATEGVQNMHHWSRRPQTSHQNWVGQAGSRSHCCSCASVASSSFSLCQGGRWSSQALLLILTVCFCDNCGLKSSLTSRIEQFQADIPVWFSCSCQLWRCTHDDRLIHKVK